MAEPVPVVVRTDGIRLGQFLKLADAIDQGSDAKAVLASGDVLVNGEQEARRGRQLASGDLVSVMGVDYLVSAESG